MTKLEKDIRRNSDREFKDHVITERHRSGVFRQWRCQKPDTFCFHFDITTIPGSIILTGDLGVLVVQRNYDMLPWCRGSCDSTDYFAEKVARGFEIEQFSHERLEAWLKEHVADEDLDIVKREICQEALDFGFDDKDAMWFYRELEDVWQGDDPPDWNEYTPAFLWQRDAIRWFVQHHSEPEILPCPN